MFLLSLNHGPGFDLGAKTAMTVFVAKYQEGTVGGAAIT